MVTSAGISALNSSRAEPPASVAMPPTLEYALHAVANLLFVIDDECESEAEPLTAIVHGDRNVLVNK